MLSSMETTAWRSTAQRATSTSVIRIVTEAMGSPLALWVRVVMLRMFKMFCTWSTFWWDGVRWQWHLKNRKYHHGMWLGLWLQRSSGLQSWCRKIRSTERGSRVGREVMVSPGSTIILGLLIGSNKIEPASPGRISRSAKSDFLWDPSLLIRFNHANPH